jgi:ketosteroid isomerase-like protein
MLNTGRRLKQRAYEERVPMSVADMTTTNTIATVEQFNHAFNAQEIEAIMALMTADCVFENTYPPPNGARSSGQAEVRATFATFFQASPGAKFEIEELVALGDRCVVRWVYRWVDAQHGPGHVRGIDLFRVQDGKIAEKLSYVKG